MKVLFHCSEYPPIISGVGMYMKNMATALAGCGQQAVVVTTSEDGGRSQAVEDGVVVHRVYDRSSRGSASVCDAVLQIACDERVDLIEGADHGGDCASLLRVRRRIPVTIKYHACQMLDILRRSHAHYWWQHAAIRLGMLRAWRQMRDELYSIEHADFACVPSKRLLEELQKQKIRLPDRLEVIPNPITVRPLQTAPEAEVPTILFVGRIEFGKGIAFLPSIIRKVAGVFPKARLEIAGSDSYARGVGSLKEWLIGELGDLQSSVTFLGPLGQVELEEAYKRAWVVVVPSLWDNFPTVVLEAMANGKAIVASTNGGMPEMLNGTGAPIANPGTRQFDDAVLTLLGDKALRVRVGEAEAVRVAREYSPEAVVPQYIKFVQSCL